MVDYGACSNCGADLVAEWFLEAEMENHTPTGRYRKAVNTLYCPYCLHEYVCDDSFDGPWFKPIRKIDQSVVWTNMEDEVFTKEIGNLIYLTCIEKADNGLVSIEDLKGLFSDVHIRKCINDKNFTSLLSRKGIKILD